MEEWKPIIGYEDSYEISSYGNLRSLDTMRNAGFRGPSLIKLSMVTVIELLKKL
jgi:NUMOD4 motif